MQRADEEERAEPSPPAAPHAPQSSGGEGTPPNPLFSSPKIREVQLCWAAVGEKKKNYPFLACLGAESGRASCGPPTCTPAAGERLGGEEGVVNRKGRQDGTTARVHTRVQACAHIYAPPIWARPCMHTHLPAHTLAHTHASVPAGTHACTQVPVHARTCVRARTHVHAMPAHTQPVRTLARACLHPPKHSHRHSDARLHPPATCTRVHKCLCRHIHANTGTRVYAQGYTHIRPRAYTHAHAHMYTGIHACTYMHAHTCTHRCI